MYVCVNRNSYIWGSSHAYIYEISLHNPCVSNFALVDREKYHRLTTIPSKNTSHRCIENLGILFTKNKLFGVHGGHTNMAQNPWVICSHGYVYVNMILYGCGYISSKIHTCGDMNICTHGVAYSIPFLQLYIDINISSQ